MSRGDSGKIELVGPDSLLGLGLATVEDLTPAERLDTADAGYTNERNVNVRVKILSGLDSLDQVAVSETGDFTDAVWTPTFAVDRDAEELLVAFTLAEGDDGERTVYVKSRTRSLVESNVVSGKVILDRVGFDTQSVTFTEGPYTTQDHVHVTPNCPGADYMRIVSGSSDVDGWDAGGLDEWVPYSASPVSVTVSGSEGVKNVQMRFRDKAGNLSGVCSASITWSTDGASEPTNLVSNHATDGVWTDYVDPHTFTWGVPETIGSSGIALYRYTTDGTVPSLTSPATAGPDDRQFVFDPPDEGGEFTIRVRAEMNTGILGNYAEFSLLLDVGTLRLTAIAPPPDSVISDTAALIVAKIEDFSKAGIDEDTIALTINGTVYHIDDAPVTWDADTGLLTFDPSAAETPIVWSGVVSIALAVSTLAGMSATLSWSFTIDLDAPGFEIEYFTDAALTVPLAGAMKAGSLYLKITANKTMAAPPTFSVDQPGLTDVANQPTTALAPTASPIELNVFLGVYVVQPHDDPLYLDGTAHVAISGTSASGNTATDEAPLLGDTFEIDTTGPTVVLGYAQQDPAHIHEGNVTIIAQFSEAIQASPLLSVVSNDDGSIVLGPVEMNLDTGNIWSVTVTIPSLPEGTYTVVIAGLDLAGNPNDPAENSQLVVDLTPPVIFSVHVTPGVCSTVRNYDVAQITFRSNEPLDPDTVVVSVGGGSPIKLATFAGASANWQRWVFEYQVTENDPEGPLAVHIEGADRAGNIGQADTVLVVDFTAPDVVVTKPATENALLADDVLNAAWEWEDANGIAVGSARVRLNGADITERCVLTATGGRFSET